MQQQKSPSNLARCHQQLETFVLFFSDCCFFFPCVFFLLVFGFFNHCRIQFVEEMEEYASVSWSEIVEKEITHYRNPGEFAERHEKLSSPSRKR